MPRTGRRPSAPPMTTACSPAERSRPSCVCWPRQEVHRANEHARRDSEQGSRARQGPRPRRARRRRRRDPAADRVARFGVDPRADSVGRVTFRPRDRSERALAGQLRQHPPDDGVHSGAKDMTSGVEWPAGRRFAFTVFDDPDAQSLEAGREVYALLADLGFRTTKAVWLMEPPERNSPGETCASPAYLKFNLALQESGFEIAYHNGAPGTLERRDVIRSLDLFREYFGTDPASMANHYNGDAMYWGDARLSGPLRRVYKLLSRGPKPHFGHVEGHPCFWGDVCLQRIRYCRNFVFRRLNTLSAWPYMP